MTLKVDREKCIGCGACIGISNEIFEFNDEGFAKVKKVEMTEELIVLAKEAMETCPTEAIYEEK